MQSKRLPVRQKNKFIAAKDEQIIQELLYKERLTS